MTLERILNLLVLDFTPASLENDDEGRGRARRRVFDVSAGKLSILNPPGSARFAPQHAIGFLDIELFFDRIPFEPAPKPQAQVHRLADGHGPMRYLRIA